MIRNPQFIMRSVVDKQLIVPVGEAAAAFHGMLSVNTTGACIWELLETEQTEVSLADALAERYEVSVEIALSDVRHFLTKLRKVGAILE